MNQLKQVLITTGFISRETSVINICCAYFQSETSRHIFNYEQITRWCITLWWFSDCFVFQLFPQIYAFCGIQTLPVLFLEPINWFWSKKFLSSSCLLDYHQNKVRPSNSKQTADKRHQWIIFLECESTWNSLKTKVKQTNLFSLPTLMTPPKTSLHIKFQKGLYIKFQKG